MAIFLFMLFLLKVEYVLGSHQQYSLLFDAPHVDLNSCVWKGDWFIAEVNELLIGFVALHSELVVGIAVVDYFHFIL